MIAPNNDKCKEYNDFYKFYGMNIKYNIIFNDMIHTFKSNLPYLSVEIKDKIEQKNIEIDNQLLCIGLKREKCDRDKLRLSISNNDLHIRNQYFNGEYDKFINFLTDYYQVIQLYANFEGTIKEFIFRKRGNEDYIKQKELINELFNIVVEKDFVNEYKKLTGMSFLKTEFVTLWSYYTNVRNLFSHAGGIISKEFISKMNKIRNEIENFERNLVAQIPFPSEKIFKIENLNENGLYIISEYELRIFRNLLVHIWETLYMLETNDKKQISDKVELIENKYEFKLLDTMEHKQVLNQIPKTVTERLKEIYISGYICPKCKNDNIFLYKTLFNSEISVNKIFEQIDTANFITEKAFTCAECNSIFFPKSKKRLDDNVGMNIINLSDDKYLEYLKILNEIGSNSKKL
jgi:hypothetical protein